VTLYRTQNKFILGGNHATWWHLKTMVDAGWNIVLSGSGTGGLYTSGNVFDMAQLPKQSTLVGPNGVGVGSEPWGRGACWAVIEDPSGNRQYIWKRDPLDNNDSYDSVWYFGYSPGGRFGEGQTPGVDWDENTIPAAPDQINVLGTPTSEGAQFQNGGRTSVIDVVADDTPSSAGEYGVLLIEFDNITSYGCVIIDNLTNTPTGHPHPLTIGLRNNNPGSLFNTGNLNENWHMRTIFDFGGPSEAWVTVNYPFQRWAGASSLNQTVPLRGGTGADGKERAVAAPVGFENGTGYMGISRWLKWAPVTHDYPVTANGGKDVFIDQAVFPDLLDGTEPPVTV
jgi:hypothetical protein